MRRARILYSLCTWRFLSHEHGQIAKGKHNTTELGANTDAKHTCGHSFDFFWQIFFFWMLTKEYVFVYSNIVILHKFKNEDDLTSDSFLQNLLSQT